MAQAYSMDLRQRVVAVSTAVKWMQRHRRTGSVAPGQMGGHKPKKLVGAHRDWLLVRCQGGAFTLRGLVAELAERGLTVDYRSVWAFVHAERLSFKKTVLALEQDRPDIARRRAQWRIYQRRIDPKRLVFIDETWTKTNMAPLRGWSPRGQRLLAKVPYGHWNTMTFLAALRHDRIEAPWLLDCPINGDRFLLYVEQVLLPSLHPGDLVIVDNLQSHKRYAARFVMRSAGAVPSCCSCRNIPQISTRSSRSSPSLSTCRARLPHAPKERSAWRSATSSTASPQRNAPPTSETQDMLPLKIIML
jgi:transposase